MIITIKNLKAKTLLGVHAHERRAKRKVIVTARIHYDSGKSAKSDILADALDYHAAEQLIVDKLAKCECYLLEKLVSELLDLIMQDTRVTEASVEIDKPGALVHAESVSVKGSRKR